jgi:hypothetical protein
MSAASVGGSNTSAVLNITIRITAVYQCPGDSRCGSTAGGGRLLATGGSSYLVILFEVLAPMDAPTPTASVESRDALVASVSQATTVLFTDVSFVGALTANLSTSVGEVLGVPLQLTASTTVTVAAAAPSPSSSPTPSVVSPTSPSPSVGAPRNTDTVVTMDLKVLCLSSCCWL